jgi:zinc D-Ala-D-Ala dipeptidase
MKYSSYLTCFFLLFNHLSKGQDSSTTKKYGLWVISEEKTYQAYVSKYPVQMLVDIQKISPSIEVDLVYSSKNNFTKKQLYPTLSTTYLCKKAALCLDSVQQLLAKKGLGLKIFDAYRPYSVTEKMWELVKDERYTANPAKGSGHNRGIAIDVTIIDAITKAPLNMGTAFDNFTDTAHHTFTNLPDSIKSNRMLLKNAMEKFGFVSLPTEWWHYSLPNARQYPLLNIPFMRLKKIVQ